MLTNKADGLLNRPQPFFSPKWFTVMSMTGKILALAGAAGVLLAQGPPEIKLEDAIVRARQYAGQVQSANSVTAQAKEDTYQARAARKPTLNAFNQFIYTEGNGTPSGVFVANDGVHVYNEQAVVHQDLLAIGRHAEVDRALAAEAVAKAKVDIASRGLTQTVIQDYYAIVAAQRKSANSRRAVEEAERFFDITQKQERGGEAAHADVVKAQIDLEQRRRDLAESQLSVDKAKIALGVMIFPAFSAEFSVVDDLEQPSILQPLAEAQAQANASSPDLKAAAAGIQQSEFDIKLARYQYIPSLAVDFFYGINANQFAVRSAEAQATGRSTLPNYEVEGRKNLGYSAQATLNIPVWNWGATRSKVKQAELRRDQAELDLSIARKTLEGSLAAAYKEASGAFAQIESLRKSANLANESLRLTLLRYQAGEATALEVVDAQNTANGARNMLDDGLSRYRVALALLASLTGNL